MLAKTTLNCFKFLARTTPLAAPQFRFSSGKHEPFKSHSSMQEPLATNHFISKNVGLNRFMQKVYNTTGLSVLGALGTSYAVLSLPLSGVALSQIAIGGFIASLVGLVGSSFMKPEYLIMKEALNNKEQTETIVARNSILRSALYGMGVMGLGLSAAPLLAFASMVSPTIVPTCLGLTTAIFGGASLAAYMMPKDKMLGYGRVLMGSLFGLIGLQLVGLGAAFFMGPNPFSLMLFKSSNYIAVGLFSVFIAYDTHFAIKMYENKEPDHLGIAVQFLLDFWNIFTSLLRIWSSSD